jgi:hypothetical protein
MVGQHGDGHHRAEPQRVGQAISSNVHNGGCGCQLAGEPSSRKSGEAKGVGCDGRRTHRTGPQQLRQAGRGRNQDSIPFGWDGRREGQRVSLSSGMAGVSANSAEPQQGGQAIGSRVQWGGVAALRQGNPQKRPEQQQQEAVCSGSFTTDHLGPPKKFELIRRDIPGWQARRNWQGV